jgi:AcrR family transcriptional regulator
MSPDTKRGGMVCQGGDADDETQLDCKRQAILAAAERAFLNGGYDLVTMDGIADGANVSKATAYAHFGNRTLCSSNGHVDGRVGAADRPWRPPRSNGPRTGAELERLLDQQRAVVPDSALAAASAPGHRGGGTLSAARQALAAEGPARAIHALAMLSRDCTENISSLSTTHLAQQRNSTGSSMGGPLNEAMLLGDRAVPSAADRRNMSGRRSPHSSRRTDRLAATSTHGRCRVCCHLIDRSQFPPESDQSRAVRAAAAASRPISTPFWNRLDRAVRGSTCRSRHR